MDDLSAYELQIDESSHDIEIEELAKRRNHFESDLKFVSQLKR